MSENPPRSARRRPALALVVGGVVVLVLLGGLATLVGSAITRPREAPPRWLDAQTAPAPIPAGAPPAVPAATATARPGPSTSPRHAVDPDSVVSLSATGDIIMANAPSGLPPDAGKGFFAGALSGIGADVAMGNLEEPLTDDTGAGKCGAGSSGCHQFRAPPGYAQHLRDAGFAVLNMANNHGNDYGAAGYRNTQKALERYGLRHTGAPGEITVVDAEGVKVAVVGFTTYAWANSMLDIAGAKKLVRKAASQADLVVVQVHMGAEGATMNHVRPGTETFLGENRGDPMKFAHAVVDAGADLVIGHGPHVLRGMEFYKGRLIAYSLGNFAGGGGSLLRTGNLKYGGVLRVSLGGDGSFVAGQLVPTVMDNAGRPTMDPDRHATLLVNELSAADLPATGVQLDTSGRVIPPTG